MTRQNAQDLISQKANLSYNSIYQIFNKPEVFKLFDQHTIIETPWRKTTSHKSLSIECADTKDPKDLIEIFVLKEALFRLKFEQARKGDGQEHKRIRTLHSSALLPLLCFYGISEEKPLELKLDNRKVTFTFSEFEVKNKVREGHYSNIDVVLCGKDENGKKVKLYLESKFSEYLHWGKCTRISNEVYGDIYKDLKSAFDEMRLAYNDGTLCSTKGNTLHYATGIKQMISHFIGLKKNKMDKDADIYLGTILYDFEKFPAVDDKHQKFEDYTNLYGKLAKGLNALTESKFKVIESCFTYQDIFKNYGHLDKNVKTFYSL